MRIAANQVQVTVFPLIVFQDAVVSIPTTAILVGEIFAYLVLK